MGDKIVLDGELSLNIPLDGEAGTVIEVGHNTGIDTIILNGDYTLTFNMTDGTSFTTGSIRGEQGAQGAKGEQGDDYVLTQADMEHIASLVNIPLATTSTAGLMSATDKTRLDDIYADYSSALTALGVI